MKRVAFAAAGLFACAALSGCSTLANLAQPGGVGDKVLQNLEACHREYSGALGAGLTGSFHIVCDPAPAKTEAPAASPTPPPGGA